MDYYIYSFVCLFSCGFLLYVVKNLYRFNQPESSLHEGFGFVLSVLVGSAVTFIILLATGRIDNTPQLETGTRYKLVQSVKAISPGDLWR